MEKLIEQSHKILSKAVKDHKPSLIICGFSGGYDSMVSTDIAFKWASEQSEPVDIIAIAIDTTVSADGWDVFVAGVAQSMNWNFRLWKTEESDFKIWAERMVERGFSYRRSHHKINFYYLKQKAIRAQVKEYKKFWNDRILFVNGVRRAESKQRSNTPEINDPPGSGVWANPIVHWSIEDVVNYRLDNDMPTNPFYDITGNSGDCVCNWTNTVLISDLTKKSPCLYKKILPYHEAALEKHGYGYDDEPKKPIHIATDDLKGFDDTPYLCDGCKVKSTSNESLDDVAMQRMKW